MISNVNKSELLQTLESTQPGLSPRNLIEQSSCFVFRQGKVWTFNGEVCCKGKSPFRKEFEAAIPSDKLLQLLRELPDDILQVEYKESQIVIRGKSGRRAKFSFEAEIGLPTEMVDDPGDWKPVHDDFADAISIVHLCASKQEDSFLSCVHIHPKWIESCDRYTGQLCRWRMRTGVSEPVLVKQDAIKHVGTLGATSFSETDSWIHFKNPNGVIMSCRRYTEADKYPDLSGPFKQEGKKLTLPKSIADAAKRAMIFSSEKSDSDYIQVNLLPGKIKVRGEGITGEYFESKKINYRDEPIGFLISPQILIDVVKKHSECYVCEDLLLVNGGNYKYASTFGDEKDETEDTEDAGSDESGEE